MSGKALAAGADRMHNPRLTPCGSLNNTSLSPGRAEYSSVTVPVTGLRYAVVLKTVVLKTVTGLRIARRGQDIIMFATSQEYGGEFVLAQFQQSLPRLPTKLNVFARAGGRDAELSILLKKMLLSRQTREPPPED